MLINAKPRFGLHEDGTLFDYVTGRIVPSDVRTLAVLGGVWNLERVKQLIRLGKPIESAFSPSVDKVEQANADFLAHQAHQTSSIGQANQETEVKPQTAAEIAANQRFEAMRAAAKK